jgi:hypothetical protein
VVDRRVSVGYDGRCSTLGKRVGKSLSWWGEEREIE